MATDRLTPIMVALLNCVADNLTEPVVRRTLMPGNSVVEDDCNGGQAFVRAISLVGSSAMSRPAIQPCYSYYQVRMGVGVSRCVATINDQGIAPSPEQMIEDVRQSLQDFADIVQGINCCFAPKMEDWGLGTLRIENWLPGSALGGCLTSEVNITFNYDACAPCE